MAETRRAERGEPTASTAAQRPAPASKPSRGAWSSGEHGHPLPCNGKFPPLDALRSRQLSSSTVSLAFISIRAAAREVAFRGIRRADIWVIRYPRKRKSAAMFSNPRYNAARGVE